MPWFERALLTVVRREYVAAMRFAEDDASRVMPAPPAAPCQLYVPVLLVPPRALQSGQDGVGSGAFSYVGGAMYSTTFSLQHYCRRVEGGFNGITQRRTLSLKERMRYDFLVRLFGGELERRHIDSLWGRAFAWRMAPELWAMLNAVNDVRERIREHVRQELDDWNEEARVPLAAVGRGRA